MAKKAKKAAPVKTAIKTAAKAAPKKPIKKSPVTGKAVKSDKSARPSKKLTPRENKMQAIRDRLLRQKSLLLGEAESAMNALPDQTIFPDLGDQATVETDRYFMLRLRGREQRLLTKIEEAIERIEQGAYGICDICGQEIHIQRLEARPVTTMCIDCKMEQEEEEKMSGA